MYRQQDRKKDRLIANQIDTNNCIRINKYIIRQIERDTEKKDINFAWLGKVDRYSNTIQIVSQIKHVQIDRQ